MERDKRAHARFATKLKCVLHMPDGSAVDARTRDLSMGGMFIETTATLSFGTQLTIAVHLPSLDAPAMIPTTVRWSTREGLGVAFGTLRAADAWAINQLASQLAPLP